MICKRQSDNKYFNYQFTDNDMVILDNPYNIKDNQIILYEKWITDYIIIDKWKTIKIL